MIRSDLRLLPVKISFPEYSNTNIYSMPVLVGSIDGIPKNYVDVVHRLYSCCELRKFGKLAHLTILEQHVEAGQFFYQDDIQVVNYPFTLDGALVATNKIFLTAYTGRFSGIQAGKLNGKILDGTLGSNYSLNKVPPNLVTWISDGCYHQEVPNQEKELRQMVILNLSTSATIPKNQTPNKELEYED